MPERSKLCVPHEEHIQGAAMTGGAKEGLQRAREIIAQLTGYEKTILRDELERSVSSSADPESSEAEGSEGAWDYQRQPYGRGWIQREPKVRPRKDGPRKVYAYWAFHWIEDGRRKSEHIGSDAKLEQWKQRNSA